MKKILIFALVFYSGLSWGDRNYTDLTEKKLAVRGNGEVMVYRSPKTPDTILFVKMIGDDYDHSSISDNEMYSEILQFYINLLFDYKFKDLDREYISFAVMGGKSGGAMRNSLFSIEHKEIALLDDRDFSSEDIQNAGKKMIPPLRKVIEHMVVVSLDDKKMSNKETENFQEFVKSYDFSSVAGAWENWIEKRWYGVDDATPSNTQETNYKILEIKDGQFDGVKNYFIGCENIDGSPRIEVLTVNAGISSYYFNGIDYKNLHSAATKSCQNQ